MSGKKGKKKSSRRARRRREKAVQRSLTNCNEPITEAVVSQTHLPLLEKSGLIQDANGFRVVSLEEGVIATSVDEDRLLWFTGSGLTSGALGTFIDHPESRPEISDLFTEVALHVALESSFEVVDEDGAVGTVFWDGESVWTLTGSGQRRLDKLNRA